MDAPFQHPQVTVPLPDFVVELPMPCSSRWRCSGPGGPPHRAARACSPSAKAGAGSQV